MLKAGALYYAILISLVISVICTLMIGLAFMSRSYFIHSDKRERVLDNSKSGIEYMLSKSSSISDGDTEIDLFGNDEDTVRMKRRNWGLFQVLYASAKFKRARFSRTAMLGYSTSFFDSLAIYLEDRNRPLLLSGTALLKGNLFLSPKGIDRAYIEGQNYSRNELFYGKMKKSKMKLPKLEIDYLKYWGKYFEMNIGEMDSLKDISEISNFKGTHPFSKKTLIYHSENPIALKDLNLKGNVMIYSEKEIVVSNSAILDQVILIAPKIELTESCKSSLHLIASDSILIGENCKINYPSSLLLLKNEAGNSFAHISDKAQFKGNILVLEKQTNKRNNFISLEIAKEAHVLGQVYCQGNFELNGSLKGSVFTTNFLLATPSGIYENHILNGEVDGTKLDLNYGGVLFSDFYGESKVIKWLE